MPRESSATLPAPTPLTVNSTHPSVSGRPSALTIACRVARLATGTSAGEIVKVTELVTAAAWLAGSPNKIREAPANRPWAGTAPAGGLAAGAGSASARGSGLPDAALTTREVPCTFVPMAPSEDSRDPPAPVPVEPASAGEEEAEVLFAVASTGAGVRS
jgi:hypothetical protein